MDLFRNFSLKPIKMQCSVDIDVDSVVKERETYMDTFLLRRFLKQAL